MKKISLSLILICGIISVVLEERISAETGKKPTRIADFEVKVKDSKSSAPAKITPEMATENSSKEAPEKAPSALRGKTITISGKLVENKGWLSYDPPIPDQSIKIYIDNTEKTTVQTGSKDPEVGKFLWDYTVLNTDSLGDHTIEAKFAGNAEYEACSASEILTIEKRETKIANLSVNPKVVLPGGTVEVKGRLEWEKRWGNDPIPGEIIELYDNLVKINPNPQPTDNNGEFFYDYLIPTNAIRGMHTIKATFEGNDIYKQSEASVQLEVELLKDISVKPSSFDPYGIEEGKTEISYTLLEESNVTIETYRYGEVNKVLKTLVNEKKQAGKHTTEWCGIINDDDYGIFIAPGGNYRIKIKAKSVKGGEEVEKTVDVDVFSP